MDHERARASFTCYHDGDLPDNVRQELEEHLAACPECLVEWEAYQRTVGEVSGLRVLAPPDDFATNIAREIRRHSPRRVHGEQIFLGLRIALLAFLLIMLFVLAYLVHMFLFADAGADDKGGAKKREHDSFQLIGPVKLEPPATANPQGAAKKE
ncbi:MAG: zf-HC2 domain-containing protein [Deltaproteobacteria bacterium]|nr:zf-HC2 domain-containing protein [Deltaproteobacteria bacterium]